MKPLRVTIEVSAARIADMMVGAIEHNNMTAAWCAGVLGRPRPKVAAPLWYADPAFYEGDFTIEVLEMPDESRPNKLKRHRVNRAGLAAGLALMAAKHGRHFGDMMAENDDAITADVFLQCIALRDVVYG